MNAMILAAGKGTGDPAFARDDYRPVTRPMLRRLDAPWPGHPAVFVSGLRGSGGLDALQINLLEWDHYQPRHGVVLQPEGLSSPRNNPLGPRGVQPPSASLACAIIPPCAEVVVLDLGIPHR
jgi:hypothetical protein